MAQGKAWNKDTIIDALEPYLQMGYPLTKACYYTDIPQSTVATWMQKDESLRLKIQALSNVVNHKVREVIIGAIQDGDVSSARWYAERKMKDEFSVRNEVTGPNGEELKLDILSDEEKNANKSTAKAEGGLDQYL